jgi:hypothetical protein
MVLGILFFWIGFWLLILPESIAIQYPLYVPSSFGLLGLFMMILHCKIMNRLIDREKPDEDTQLPLSTDHIPSIFLDPLYHAL